MDKGSKRKRVSTSSYNDGVDRLSALPDAILCHILSFLDTKYAVATSILSTRWKNLCLTVPNIVFDHSSFPIRRTLEFECDFPRFCLKRIMLQNVLFINRFRLRCNFDLRDPSIKTLVCAAIWRDVKELNICMRASRVMLPPEIFTSQSLVVLTLGGDLDLPVLQIVCLPNLKVLRLKHVKFPGDHVSMRRLFEGCKLLVDLSLTMCRTFECVDVVDFSIQSLRKLTIKYIYGVSKFIINTPNLEVFEYDGLEFQLVNELKFLERAKISFIVPENFYQLIDKMHRVKSLDLSPAISPITLKVMNLIRDSLHVFEDLTHLKLG